MHQTGKQTKIICAHHCKIRSEKLLYICYGSHVLLEVCRERSPLRPRILPTVWGSRTNSLRWWFPDVWSEFTKVKAMLSNLLTWSARAPPIESLPGHPPTSLIPCWHVSWSVMAALMYVCTSATVVPGELGSMSATKYMEALTWSSESAMTCWHCTKATFLLLPFSMWTTRLYDSFTALSADCNAMMVHCCMSTFWACGLLANKLLQRVGYLINQTNNCTYTFFQTRLKPQENFSTWPSLV